MSGPSGERRPGRMRRVVIVVPSAFTLGNLFFGFWAIISAFNGNYRWAGWFIVFAGVLDMLDGRIARLSNSGSRFGAELDSLVDLTSFGVAPALLIYLQELSTAGRFAWLICYGYVVAAAIRLARYNVGASDGHAPSRWFTGLPSPAAGMTLAVSWAFSQTEWYGRSLALVNFESQGLVMLMLLLAVLMVSSVKYPRWPAAGFRSPQRLLGTALYLAVLVGGLTMPELILFPLGLTYVAYGLVRALLLALTERQDPDNGSDEPDPLNPTASGEELSA
ncbi:MAG TPA: CDP-diacylglycerol--serine O-phosphatidyltransferase [Gemmatimonadales bacterium]|nr:CDP-diacylglycerol--serine O-phosphatidyltransferase [Gemmatimonadales bacterium]HRX18795.1 CDP-diacylglycerol--serine O-phosphatidyltransferase [Gemmatimonadales bacterium]